MCVLPPLSAPHLSTPYTKTVLYSSFFLPLSTPIQTTAKYTPIALWYCRIFYYEFSVEENFFNWTYLKLHISLLCLLPREGIFGSRSLLQASSCEVVICYFRSWLAFSKEPLEAFSWQYFNARITTTVLYSIYIIAKLNDSLQKRWPAANFHCWLYHTYYHIITHYNSTIYHYTHDKYSLFDHRSGCSSLLSIPYIDTPNLCVLH